MKYYSKRWKGNDEQGSILIIGYFVIVVLLGLGAVFMTLIVNEAKVAERQRLNSVAFQIAEAGIERALYDLRQDFINDTGTPSWSDNDINGMAIGPDSVNFYAVPYQTTTLNNGSYVVSFKNSVDGKDVWVRSTGTINDVSHTLDVYVRMINVSPWDNAIFAGAGASGAMVNGNVNIRGSVHILGSGLNPGDYAVDLGGTAELVGNNYNGLAASLKAKVPALPTTVINGETVETLDAELRVKKGLVGLSGSSTVGELDIFGNSVKEKVDGVYVTDGWGGNQGAASVFSENETTNAYDLGDSVAFPSLSDPSPSNPLQTNQQYFQSTSLNLTNQLTSVTPGSSFSYSDGAGNSISMSGGVLTVQGKVYVGSNNSVTFTKQGSNKTITYAGSGTLLVEGNVQINTDLVTSGNNSFPNNIMGIMTPGDINMNEAGIDVMGIFYAENKIVVQKQTDVVGTIVSNYFDMGTNVPSIFQVPETVNNLPAGMIGDDILWYMVVAWMKV